MFQSLQPDIRTFIDQTSNLTDIDTLTLYNVWNTTTSIPRTSENVLRTEDAKCSYVFQKGINPGKICGDSCMSSSVYCKKHAKLEQKEKAPVKTTASAVKTQLLISKNEYGNHEHKATNLVFNTETRLVYGKQIGENIVPLNFGDVEQCKRYGFKYSDESLAVPESLEPQDDETLFVSSF